MTKYKVSVVSYSNAIPFVYGLEVADFLSNELILQKDLPAEGAEKLRTNEVDIALIPVATISSIPNYNIISDFCIGAIQKVDSVMLYSDVPLNEIKCVLLDSESRTSNRLAKLLAKEFWKINPQWVESENEYKSKNCAKVLIGDKAIGVNAAYVFDLAEEWHKYSGLPFVFACWVANKSLDPEFISDFNSALLYGVNNIDASIAAAKRTFPYDIDNYLNNCIDYRFDYRKKQALSKFLFMTQGFVL